MAYEGPCVSCDSHILEVPEIFDGLQERYGDEAPKIVHDPERGAVLDIPGHSAFVNIGRFGIAGHFANDPETIEMVKQGYPAMRPGVLDPDLRIKDQDLDGIDAEVLLPSVLMGINTIDNKDVIAATYKNYNDWVLNYTRHQPARLFPTSCLPMHDMDLAIAELERTVAQGHVGVNIPCVPPKDKPYSDPFYEPFWNAAEEAGTPLVMHFLTSTQPNHGLPEGMSYGTGYGLAAFAIQRVIVDIIGGGVCERHPKLKFVPTEWETGWVAHFLQRMDWVTYKGSWSKESFTHYFQQNFTVTFEDDRVGLATRHEIGIKNLMWGSDFPHHDSTFPRSQDVLEDIFDGIPDDERRAITYTNVKELYSLPV
jgi:predicted TIM-barrel fold metal-dependent hydrolase